MGWSRLLLAVVCTGAFLAAGAAAQCELSQPGQTISYPGCEDPDSGGDEPKEPFWTSSVAQALYGLVALAGSGAAGLVAWNRVRRRRRSLRETLSDVETTFTSCKDDPEAGIERLTGLRAEIRTRHDHGRIEDPQFLSLDRQIADYLARLRLIDLEHRIPGLPVPLLQEIRELAKDGVMSRADVARVKRRASALRLPAAETRNLLAYLSAWTALDEAPPEPAAVAVAPS